MYIIIRVYITYEHANTFGCDGHTVRECKHMSIHLHFDMIHTVESSYTSDARGYVQTMLAFTFFIFMYCIAYAIRA